MPPEIRNTVTLRRATNSDLPALWSIRTDAIRQGCATHYSPDVVAAWASVTMPDGFVNALLESEFIVAEVDGSLAGFGFLNPLTREVEGIFVSPILHRHGVGSRLMRALQDRARALGVSKLWLNASLNAETFYSSLGFVVVQRTLWNHPNGFALLCVLMEKVLPTPSSRSTLSSAD